MKIYKNNFYKVYKVYKRIEFIKKREEGLCFYVYGIFFIKNKRTS